MNRRVKTKRRLIVLFRLPTASLLRPIDLTPLKPTDGRTCAPRWLRTPMRRIYGVIIRKSCRSVFSSQRASLMAANASTSVVSTIGTPMSLDPITRGSSVFQNSCLSAGYLGIDVHYCAEMILIHFGVSVQGYLRKKINRGLRTHPPNMPITFSPIIPTLLQSTTGAPFFSIQRIEFRGATETMTLHAQSRA